MTGIHNANFSPTLFEQSGVEEIREEGENLPKRAEAAQSAAAAILAYLEENQKDTLGYIQSLVLYQRSGYLVIDKNTERNLELLASTGEGAENFPCWVCWT